MPGIGEEIRLIRPYVANNAVAGARASVEQSTSDFENTRLLLVADLATAYFNLRQVDVELQDTSGALEDLQSLHQNIIHSMRGGLITTAMVALTVFGFQRLAEFEMRWAWAVVGAVLSNAFIEAIKQIDHFFVSVVQLPSGGQA